MKRKVGLWMCWSFLLWGCQSGKTWQEDPKSVVELLLHAAEYDDYGDLHYLCAEGVGSDADSRTICSLESGNEAQRAYFKASFSGYRLRDLLVRENEAEVRLIHSNEKEKVIFLIKQGEKWFLSDI